ncbi:hypothetical protein BC938DRAFT_472192 [Jimgerdemannia flammicorona]|uniref:Cytochrome P450 n=1 Tax=Jimgerdemannia flammicorona TaxID=994334 RepID=A0A433Q6M0_9FUNG|nr:hypothetical protein BC938DRAFT_472192 [Jimgerdemannia flammicorona]
MLFILLPTLLALGAAYHYLRKPHPLSSIPTPSTTHFLFGNALELDANGLTHYYATLRQRGLGPVYRIRLLFLTLVVVNDLVLTRQILLGIDPDDQNARPKAGKALAFDRPSLHTLLMATMLGGDSIIGANGDTWRSRRTTLVPLFQPRVIVPKLLPLVVQRMDELVRGLRVLEAVEVDELFTRFTLSVILGYIFGDPLPAAVADVTRMRELYRPFLPEMGRLAMRIGLFGPVGGWVGGTMRRARDELKRRIGEAVDECLRVFREEGEERPVPLVVELTRQPMYDSRVKESRKRLIDDIVALLFAGHDTTAHTLSFTLHHIATIPGLQSTLLAESLSVLGPLPSNDTPSEPPTSAQLSCLTHTTATIRETLRLYPISPIINVSAQHTATRLSDHVLPLGTVVHVDIRGLARDPCLFANPEAFQPERWLETRALAREGRWIRGPGCRRPPRRSQAPEFGFGLGLHACLGKNLAMLEARCAVAWLVRAFVLQEGRVGAVVEPDYSGTIAVPKGGVWIKFEKQDLSEHHVIHEP